MMGRRAAKIAKVKGREDAKRGKAFARIGKKIIMVSAAMFRRRANTIHAAGRSGYSSTDCFCSLQPICSGLGCYFKYFTVEHRRLPFAAVCWHNAAKSC